MPFPIAGNLLDPGIEALSLESPALAGRFFTTVPLINVKEFHLNPSTIMHVS